MKLRPVISVGATLSLLALGTIPAHADNGTQDVQIADAEALAQALVGENIVVQNVTYTGHERSAGLFSGFEEGVGIESGIILSTGHADHEYAEDGETILRESVIYGPNQIGTTSGSMGTDGDADLDELVDGQTRDAAVLEIEFIPEGETVSFNYVFGSEEYPDFVGSNFNDVFAFFVNGQNYATVAGEDGEDVFVAINNINHESNSSLYRANDEPDEEDNYPFNTGLDGMTTVLGFEADVTPGEVNTLKLAIADVQDRIYDSSVLIQSGSFTSFVNTPPVADDIEVDTEFNTPVDLTLSGSDYDEDELTFEVVNTEDLAGELTVDGTAVTFTPEDGFSGSTSFTYIANDGEDDSEEATVTINVADAPSTAPEAESQVLATAVDTPLDIELVAVDPNDDPLTYTTDTEGLNGTLEGEGTAWTFTPEEGFLGETSFTFVANDGEEDSNVATVTIHVTEDGELPNTPPVAEDLAIETEFDTPAEITLSGSDADEDGLTYEVINTDDLAGELEIDGANVIFTPEAGFSGTTSFTYVANDGIENSEEATVTITVAEEVIVEPTPTETPTTEPSESPTSEPTETPTTEPSESASSTPAPTESSSAPADETDGDDTAGETVVDEDPSDEDELAITGATLAPVAIAAVLLLAAGAVMLFSRRRTVE